MRRGTTLVELLLFLAFFALSSGVLLSFFFMTSEQRIRQQTIAIVEQSGIQLLQTITHRIRNAERVLDPPSGSSGSVLALELHDSDLHPTILSLSGAYLYVGEGNSVRRLSTDEVMISDMSVTNTSALENTPSVLLRFTVTRDIALTTPVHYVRQFEALVSLFPDDAPNPPCSCENPSCTEGVYSWQYCVDTTCTNTDVSLPCG